MPNKVVRLTESDIKKMIMDGVIGYRQHQMLCEDRESKNMKIARNVVRQSNPNIDPQQVLDAVRSAIPNSRLEDCKYLPGVVRMYMDGEINDNFGKLDTTLGLISKGHSEEYDGFLNNESAETLIDRFASEGAEELEKDKAEHGKVQFTRNDEYEIVKITNAAQASKYGKYTDWCITSTSPSSDSEENEYAEDDDDYQTRGEEMYDSYTSNGLGLFYFCLRKGYQDVPRKSGENCPLDDYGLSMIATCVDEDGRCKTITCRWNHENGGNDNIMTPMQLSQVIGRNYYQTFLPYTKEELYAKGIVPFSDVDGLLANGMDPGKIFKNMKKCDNGYLLVQLNSKYNFYIPSENRILMKGWLNFAQCFVDGVALIITDSGQNYINEKGEKLLKKDVQYGLKPFSGGYGLWSKYVPEKSVTENYVIDKNGRIVNEGNPIIGYDVHMESGLIVVKKDKKASLFKPDGTPCVDMTFDSVYKSNLGDGFLRVTKKVGNEAGESSNENYKYKEGLVGPDGKLVGGSLFDSISRSKDGYLFIQGDNEGKSFILDPKGNMVMNTKFDSIDGAPYNKLYKVTLNGKCNWLNFRENRMLFRDWHDGGTPVGFDKCFKVIDNGKTMVFDEDGRPLANMAFDKVENAFRNYKQKPELIVELNGQYSVLTKDGLLNQWFDNKPYAMSHINDKLLVKIEGKPYYIDMDTLQVLPYDEKTRTRDRKAQDDWEDIKRDSYRSW